MIYCVECKGHCPTPHQCQTVQERMQAMERELETSREARRIVERKLAEARSTPPGWKLVPVEPTPEMLEAAKPWPKHWTDEYLGTNKPNALAAYHADQMVAESTYRTMLAAAPEAPHV